MTIKTYRIITDDDEVLTEGLTLAEAEQELTRELNAGSDAYIQDE